MAVVVEPPGGGNGTATRPQRRSAKGRRSGDGQATTGAGAVMAGNEVAKIARYPAMRRPGRRHRRRRGSVD